MFVLLSHFCSVTVVSGGTVKLSRVTSPICPYGESMSKRLTRVPLQSILVRPPGLLAMRMMLLIVILVC